jgi:hypothetical protein
MDFPAGPPVMQPSAQLYELALVFGDVLEVDIQWRLATRPIAALSSVLCGIQ